MLSDAAADLGYGASGRLNTEDPPKALLTLSGGEPHVPFQVCCFIVDQHTVHRVGRLQVVAAQHNLEAKVVDCLGQAQLGLHSPCSDTAIDSRDACSRMTLGLQHYLLVQAFTVYEYEHEGLSVNGSKVR